MSHRPAAPKGARTAALQREGSPMSHRPAAPKGARTAALQREGSPVPPCGRRVAIGLLLGALVPGLAGAGPKPAAARAGALPAVNLRIEWRLQPAPAPVAGPAGGLTVGTALPPPAGWRTVRSTDAAGDAGAAPVQAVIVANGHEAALQLDDARSRRRHDFVWTAQGQGVVSRDEPVHEVRAMQATPRWAGGDTAVDLTLRLARATPGVGAEDADRALALSTSLRLPLDAWTAVGRVATAGAPPQELQVRVVRP